MVALYVYNNNVTYFDSFGVEHIPKEIKTFTNRPLSSALQNKNITTNIFRIQAYDSIMYGYILYWVYWFCACRKNPNWIYSKISRLTDLISRFNNKKSRFIKNQEAKGLWSNLGIKTPLSKVPI